jgi:hypothetical protein
MRVPFGRRMPLARAIPIVENGESVQRCLGKPGNRSASD